MTVVPEIDSWLSFFRARRRRTPEAAEEHPLDPGHRALIARSIATFQLGESSDGGHLRAAARAFAGKHGLAALPEITDLFIAEEQFHAALLAAFMNANGIPSMRSQWTDRVFRALRRHAGFEPAIAVLLVAEIIALVYYQALAEATPSRALRAICATILADERAHVAYESTLLLRFRLRRSAFGRICARAVHHVLFAGAVAVVFLGHRGVLRAGGFTFRRFQGACRAEFLEALGTLASPRVAPALTTPT
jgi:hypothetical protein